MLEAFREVSNIVETLPQTLRITADAAVVDHHGAKLPMKSIHRRFALAVEQAIDARLGAV